jgi:hypothetical protein
MYAHFHPVDCSFPPESDLPPNREEPSCGPKKVWMWLPIAPATSASPSSFEQRASSSRVVLQPGFSHREYESLYRSERSS